MKITKNHYEILKNKAIDITNKYPNWEVPEYNDTRNRWNVFHAICDDDKYTFAKILWKYLHDDHIDTALKNIIKEIKGN